MEEQLELKQNEAGQVVQVVTVTSTEEVPVSSHELQRQIDEQEQSLARTQGIISQLRSQLAQVEAFEATLPPPVQDDTLPEEINEESETHGQDTSGGDPITGSPAV